MKIVRRLEEETVPKYRLETERVFWQKDCYGKRRDQNSKNCFFMRFIIYIFIIFMRLLASGFNSVSLY